MVKKWKFRNDRYEIREVGSHGWEWNGTIIGKEGVHENNNVKWTALMRRFPPYFSYISKIMLCLYLRP